MRSKVRPFVEAKKLVLSRRVRLREGRRIEPTDESRLGSLLCAELMAGGVVLPGDVDALAAGCVLAGGMLLPTDAAAAAFSASMLANFSADPAATDVERRLLSSSAGAVTRLFVEEVLVRMLHRSMLVDDGEPRGRAQASAEVADLVARLERRFVVAMLAERGAEALAYVESRFAVMRSAVRAWRRRVGPPSLVVPAGEAVPRLPWDLPAGPDDGDGDGEDDRAG